MQCENFLNCFHKAMLPLQQKYKQLDNVTRIRVFYRVTLVVYLQKARSILSFWLYSMQQRSPQCFQLYFSLISGCRHLTDPSPILYWSSAQPRNSFTESVNSLPLLPCLSSTNILYQSITVRRSFYHTRSLGFK